MNRRSPLLPLQLLPREPRRPLGRFPMLQAVALGGVLLLGGGCQTEIDTTQQVAFDGTLGEKIHREFCQRFASASGGYPDDLGGRMSRALCDGVEAPDAATPVQLRALVDERARTVAALDAAMPEPTYDDLADLLLAIRPLADDGTIPNATDALAAVLTDVTEDGHSAATFARFSHRQGYRPLRFGLGMARPVMRYPALHDVTTHALAALSTTGVAADPFTELLRAGALEMATLAPSEPTAGSPTDLTLARDLLFTEDSFFAGNTTRWTVQRDRRGIALPTGVGVGPVPSPYRDADADHLPDVDALGRFVDASGTPLARATPFPIVGESGIGRDAQGRALAAGGGLVFQYRELDRTLAAGLLRELAPYFSAPTPSTPPLVVQVARALPAMLGAPEARSRTYGATTLAYPGFDSDEAPALELVHALAAIMHRAETADGLAVVDTLLVDHEPELAALVDTAMYGRSLVPAHPAAKLGEGNVFWDELLAPIERMGATPGMLESVLRATDSDAVQDLDEVIALFMRNRDAVTFNPADSNAAIPAGALTLAVNRTATDASAANESLLQRSVHLIHDLERAQVCNKQGAMVHVQIGIVPLTFGPYERCELIQIDNVAKAYVEAYFGRFRLVFKDDTLQALIDAVPAIGDTLLQGQTGITGMKRYPTPEALARLVFAPRNQFLKDIFDDVMTADGVPVEDRHCIGRAAGDRTSPCPNAIIFAWEKPILLADGSHRRFLDAIGPLLDAMASHETGDTLYFGQIAIALHRHYASHASGRTQRTSAGTTAFSFQDDIRSYEPLASSVFATGRPLHRLRALLQAADELVVRPGTDGIDALAALAELMVDPAKSCVGACTSSSLAYRDGRRFICWEDGTCFDGQGGRARRYPSPLYLTLDALGSVDDAWESEASRHANWLAARSRIADQFFTTETFGGAKRLENRRATAILRAVLPFLHARIVDNRSGGDAAARSWARDREESLTETLGGPLAAALVRMLDALDRDPGARDSLLGLLATLLDETQDPEGMGALLHALSDALYVLEDDERVVPLVNALSSLLAPNARSVAASGGEVDSHDAAVTYLVRMLQRTGEVDAHGVLAEVLGNAASFPATGPEVTRLETIVDVVAQVNRVAPGAPGPVDEADVVAILRSVHEALTDEVRGADRLFEVITNRTVQP